MPFPTKHRIASSISLPLFCKKHNLLTEYSPLIENKSIVDKIHITKSKDRIPYCALSNSHLINLKKFISRKKKYNVFLIVLRAKISNRLTRYYSLPNRLIFYYLMNKVISEEIQKRTPHAVFFIQ